MPSEADVAVVRSRFEPQFVRVAAGTCVRVANTDAQPYALVAGGVSAAVERSGTQRLCLDAGVHRVRTTGTPFDGGFVIVDQTAEQDAS